MRTYAHWHCHGGPAFHQQVFTALLPKWHYGTQNQKPRPSAISTRIPVEMVRPQATKMASDSIQYLCQGVVSHPKFGQHTYHQMISSHPPTQNYSCFQLQGTWVRRRHEVPLKRRYISTELYGINFRKTIILLLQVWSQLQVRWWLCLADMDLHESHLTTFRAEPQCQIAQIYITYFWTCILCISYKEWKRYLKNRFNFTISYLHKNTLQNLGLGHSP